MEHVTRVGAHFELRLRELAARHPIVTEVRGQGVMRGLELTVPASNVVDAARPLGLLANATAKTVLRLLPPLTVTESEIDEAIGVIDAAMASAGGRS